MAEQKKRVIDLDKLRATKKVRYDRANLTVEKWVSVHGTRIEQALRAHRQGKASVEDVGWAFVKEQVTAFTSSFDWADADLAKLLPRIIAAAEVPKLKAKSAVELVPELEEIEAKERERWEKLSERIRISILPTLPKIGITIPDNVLKAYRPNVPKLPISEALQSQILQTNKKIAEGLKANPNFKAFGKPDLKVLEGLRLDLDQISKTVRPQIPPLGIDLDHLSQLTGFQPGGEWFESLRRLAEEAREAGASVAAGAAEATLSEQELEPLEVDLQAIYERLKELLEALAPDDSFRRTLIEGAIATAIIRFLEYVLTGS